MGHIYRSPKSNGSGKDFLELGEDWPLSSLTARLTRRAETKVDFSD